MGEWCDRLNAFWFGANGCEHIAFKHSHTIFIYPIWEHPNPPSEIIHYHKPIETVEDFDDALMHGKKLRATYTDNPHIVSADLELTEAQPWRLFP